MLVDQSYKQALKTASYLYRDKWIQNGVPSLKHFFHNVLDDADRFKCYYISHEIINA